MIHFFFDLAILFFLIPMLVYTFSECFAFLFDFMKDLFEICLDFWLEWLDGIIFLSAKFVGWLEYLNEKRKGNYE